LTRANACSAESHAHRVALFHSTNAAATSRTGDLIPLTIYSRPMAIAAPALMASLLIACARSGETPPTHEVRDPVSWSPETPVADDSAPRQPPGWRARR
jgi:hypothetical protein